MRYKKGFTLVELLVVVAIIAVIAGIGGDMFATVMRTYRKAEIFSLADRIGSGILTQMEQDIRSAIDVETPTDDQFIANIPTQDGIVDKEYTFIACTGDTEGSEGSIKLKNGENILESENLFNQKVFLKKLNNSKFVNHIFDVEKGYDIVYISFVIGVGGTCETPDTTVYMQTSVNLRGGLEY